MTGQRLSICEFTTLNASVAEDIEAYRAAGATGIGVCELKLGDGDVERVLESGLHVTHCVPQYPSILPLSVFPGPEDVRERIDALCASVARLAVLEPDCVIFLTGPLPERRDQVIEGIKRIAAAAAEAGVTVALEPIHSSQADVLSYVNTIPATVELLEEAGCGSVGIMFDTWHLWDTPQLGQHIREQAGRISGVHVADRREQTRNDFDRALPGEGVIDLPPILRALEQAGYDGWYDVEIFSDDGTFGSEFPDSLWALPAAEAAQRVRESFDRVWSAV
jgi:sugar phosphate isomerase/epimerase